MGFKPSYKDESLNVRLPFPSTKMHRLYTRFPSLVQSLPTSNSKKPPSGPPTFYPPGVVILTVSTMSHPGELSTDKKSKPKQRGKIAAVFFISLCGSDFDNFVWQEKHLHPRNVLLKHYKNPQNSCLIQYFWL